MTEIDFLSPDAAVLDGEGAARFASPLARALAHAPATSRIRDLSRTGKVEVRGDIDGIDVDGAELVRISERRALVLCDFEECRRVREGLRASGRLVVDMTGALAGLEVAGERLMRRLTDLDLHSLPAVGALAHVQAVVIRDEGETFRIFVPQELGHYVAEVVLDTAQGL